MYLEEMNRNITECFDLPFLIKEEAASAAHHVNECNKPETKVHHQYRSV